MKLLYISFILLAFGYLFLHIVFPYYKFIYKFSLFLHANNFYKKNSGRRDSNPRRQPWEGCILPLNYVRIQSLYSKHFRLVQIFLFLKFYNIFITFNLCNTVKTTILAKIIKNTYCFIKNNKYLIIQFFITCTNRLFWEII